MVTIAREGPAAAWEKISEQLSNVKEFVVDEVLAFVRSRIVRAAVTRLLGMLSPAGAFIQAIIAIHGSYGTLSEIALALKCHTPVVGLGTWDLTPPGGEELPITYARNAEEAVTAALNLISTTQAGSIRI